MEDTWLQFSFFESTDLIKQFYKKKHGLAMNSGKAKEIVSSFAQGREYFNSAKNASILVRPLLLYYGVLALSRGLILFLDHSTRENSLKKSHGLEVVNWGNELANGIDKLPTLKVKLHRSGTFFELCQATSNLETSIVYIAPFPNTVVINKPVTPSFNNTLVSINEIISRIPELYELYETTFNTSSNCFPCIVFILSWNSQTDISVFETSIGSLDENLIRRKFSIPDDIKLVRSNRNNFFGNINNYSYRLLHSGLIELISKLPLINNDDKNNIYLIALALQKISLQLSSEA